MSASWSSATVAAAPVPFDGPGPYATGLAAVGEPNGTTLFFIHAAHKVPSTFGQRRPTRWALTGGDSARFQFVGRFSAENNPVGEWFSNDLWVWQCGDATGTGPTAPTSIQAFDVADNAWSPAATGYPLTCGIVRVSGFSGIVDAEAWVTPSASTTVPALGGPSLDVSGSNGVLIDISAAYGGVGRTMGAGLVANSYTSRYTTGTSIRIASRETTATITGAPPYQWNSTTVPLSGMDVAVTARIAFGDGGDHLWTLCSESPADAWADTGSRTLGLGSRMETEFGDPVGGGGFPHCATALSGCNMLAFPTQAYIGPFSSLTNFDLYGKPWTFECYLRVDDDPPPSWFSVYFMGDGDEFDGEMFMRFDVGTPNDTIVAGRKVESTGDMAFLTYDVPAVQRGCVHHVAWRYSPQAQTAQLFWNGDLVDTLSGRYTDTVDVLSASLKYGPLVIVGDADPNVELSYLRWTQDWVDNAVLVARASLVEGCCPGTNVPCVPIVNVVSELI